MHSTLSPLVPVYPVFITVIADHDKPQPSGCLLESQGSLCPICRQRITHETGWNVHHKVKKVMGGGEELSNLVLLHPNCHRQLHSCEAGSLKKG
ncbi:HNH endonuclease signature motif containing protein, partial [Shigella boydii]|nr:HNH endonuclease [Shigella boydii]EFW0985652.1 HNH endonuclease [Shigella boydii]EFY5143798.1 HNH endonuclease [Shigella boydii]EFY9938372.1 HNH endonuclease [Shigella boydii]EFZ0000218.1 HNH endonuclease [Shigella boydii]